MMVKSAQRVLQLLELLSALPDAVGVTEVARYLSMPKSSAQALLETLVGCGYAERSGTGFILAASVREGGWVGGELALLKRAARPVMQKVVTQTGESAFIGVKLPNWQIRYVDKVVSQNEVRYDGGLAHDRPAYCTSIGLLFLADADAAGLEAYLKKTKLERITAATETDAARLRKTVARVAKAGWSESRNGHVDGASGIAAPIRGASGRLVAGLTVGAPTWRFDSSRDSLIEHTIEAAREISRNLRTMVSPGDTVRPAPANSENSRDHH